MACGGISTAWRGAVRPTLTSMLSRSRSMISPVTRPTLAQIRSATLRCPGCIRTTTLSPLSRAVGSAVRPFHTTAPGGSAIRRSPPGPQMVMTCGLVSSTVPVSTPGEAAGPRPGLPLSCSGLTVAEGPAPVCATAVPTAPAATTPAVATRTNGVGAGGCTAALSSCRRARRSADVGPAQRTQHAKSPRWTTIDPPQANIPAHDDGGGRGTRQAVPARCPGRSASPAHG